MAQVGAPMCLVVIPWPSGRQGTSVKVQGAGQETARNGLTEYAIISPDHRDLTTSRRRTRPR